MVLKKNLCSKSVNMQMFPVAVFLLVAVAAVKAQEFGEDAIEQIVCSEEETMRSSVVQCISLMPRSHLEIIQTCDTRLAEIGEDYGRLLDFFCNNEAVYEESDKCVTEAYRTRGKSEFEPIRPVVECLQSMLTSK